VLRDPGLSSQHLSVMAALSAIFKSLGLLAVPYLPKVGAAGALFMGLSV
jgi:hypothetical protein